jgi:hypothetical protein
MFWYLISGENVGLAMSLHAASRVKIICLISLALLSRGNVRGESDAEILSKIRSSWEERRNSMKSFEYVCALEVVEKTRIEKPDAFGELDPLSLVWDAQLRKTLTFAADNGKLTYRLEGEHWSQVTRAIAPYFFHVVYDGSGNRSLLQQKFGTIDHVAEPASHLTNGLYLKALWLSIDPKAYLKRLGYEIDRMSVADKDAFYDGRECIEVLIPRGNANSQGRLYIDSSKECLPIAFLAEHQGSPRNQVVMEYRPHDKVGWALAGWSYAHYARADELEMSIIGKVTKHEVNSAPNKNLFNVKFPPGTQVIEKVGQQERYFIQMPDGSLKRIRLEDLGKPSRAI